jgi:hypothetical protein
MAQRGESAPAYFGCVDRSLFDVPNQQPLADAIIGILSNPARAHHIAVTDFEKTAFHRVGHDSSSIVFAF